MTEKTVNYTEAQIAEIVEVYQSNPTLETVQALAAKLGKSVKSVIAKLAQQKVYKTQTAQKAKTRTKADLVAMIATNYGVEAITLQSLEKASKEALEVLVAGFEQE